MANFLLKKKDLTSFLEGIRKNYDLIAPVKTNETRVEKIDDTSKIYLGGLSLYPIKKWLINHHEIIFSFENNKIKEKNLNVRPMVLFGLRKCDLNSINRQDIAYNAEFEDPYYLK